ncbi:MAG: sodium:solute symporter [Bacteroidota bacterium]
MSPLLIILIISGYFGLLFCISWFTGKDNNNRAFFLGNKKSPWFIVAFGMIGASLSGVTFISVPGWVGDSQFGYMQVVLGYLVGYFVISFVLMPIYYKLNLTSIYSYLEQRFGKFSYKTGAFYFMLSRIIGASFRLYLVANVLQEFIFKEWGVPFEVTVIISILFIWLYTFRGGIKTIVWTDTLQTLFMLLAVGVSIFLIAGELDLGIGELASTIAGSDYSKMFFFDDLMAKDHFVKQFLGGAFIAITMTGLDQDMMQKNLTCKNIGDAQKNMISFSLVIVFANLFFLALGALLFIYASKVGIDIPGNADLLYPTIALNGHLSIVAGVFFILGLVAAAYSSADSALTALTTSFCVDFLDIKKMDERRGERTRKITHVVISAVLLVVIIIFSKVTNKSVIDEILTVAAYTYGPLLGLYAFGILTKRKVLDKLVPVICIASPILTHILKIYSIEWFYGYEFGYELIVVNGILTFGGLLAITKFRGKDITL